MYDIANLFVYTQHLYITSLNPRVVLVRVKTYLLGYINIEHEIDTDDYEWGKVKREWLPPTPGQVCDVFKTCTSYHI